MCNAFILGMLAMLALNPEAGDRVWFWVYWCAALILNMNWWRRIEDKNGNYDDTDEKHLFWLRNNFYAVGSGYGVSEKANFYENAILARAGL